MVVPLQRGVQSSPLLSSCELAQRAFRSPVLSPARWGVRRAGEEERSQRTRERILSGPAVITPDRARPRWPFTGWLALTQTVLGG